MVDYTNLNGSVNLNDKNSEVTHRDTWVSRNFLFSTLFARSLALNGGSYPNTYRWWRTPLALKPFVSEQGVLRAPEELLTETEWRSLRNFLCDNVIGDWIDDVDFYNEHQGLGMAKLKDNILIEPVFAESGSAYSTTYLSKAGDYMIHRFTSSGDLNVKQGGVVEYLIVGGGGGGGGNYAGGGGGGGSVVTGFKRLAAGIYPIVIGAGGGAGIDAGLTNANDGGRRDSTEGGNSTAFGFTAYGGGAGAGQDNQIFSARATVKGRTMIPTEGSGVYANARGVDNSNGIGTGGGGSAAFNAGAFSNSHVKGSNAEGYRGGNGYTSPFGTDRVILLGGGGGGAGGAGQNAQVTTLTNVACISSTGIFTCDDNSFLYGQNMFLNVVVTGTLTGTATITGYSNPTLYSVKQINNGTFQLFTWSASGTPAAVVTTAGTTTGLTFVLTTNKAGDGGIGIRSVISDTATYYGGGGGGGAHGPYDYGGAGGLGGGATAYDGGQSSSVSRNGTANTGGGGAGASGKSGVVASTGGLGGSGVVIIRYPRGTSVGPNKANLNTQQPDQLLS